MAGSVEQDGREVDGSVAESREAVVRHLIRGLILRLFAANLVGASLVAIYLSVVSPPRALIDSSEVAFFAALTLAYLGLMGLFGVRNGKRIAAPVLVWVVQNRVPTSEQRRLTLAQPHRQSLWVFVYWVGAAVMFAPLNFLPGFDNPPIYVAQVIIAVLLGGLTTTALSFLFIERSLRPIFALALADDVPEEPRTVGIRLRLIASWALGSGIALLAILLMLAASRRSDETGLFGPILFLALIGLVAGWVMTTTAADSVVEPVLAVRKALSRVQHGDLDFEIAVDDGAEVGILQAGFNEMVAGLRERRRLQDLFGRHVGTEVARDALQRGIRLGGEQREASVLFIDLIGSTHLAQLRPPDEVVALLNAMFRSVVRTVEAEGGSVNRLEGDGALCVFGVPIEQPDHAARALRAARTLRKAILQLAKQYPEVDVGIGVSSGTVLAGNVGAEDRFQYTVIGDAVNEAARLTAVAKKRRSRVLASRETLQRAGDEGACWMRSQTVQLRGRATPTDTYEPA